MVLPMEPVAMGGMMQPLPPPPELNKFRPVLFLLSAGYAGVIVLILIGSDVLSCIIYVMLAWVVGSMACRPMYLGQCVLPLSMLACLVLILDVLRLVQLLSQTIPGFSRFLKFSCPLDETFPSVDLQNYPDGATVIYFNQTTARNVTVILNMDDRLGIPKIYNITRHLTNVCTWRTFCHGLGMVLAIMLDFVATMVGCQMWKVATSILTQAGLLNGGMGGGMGDDAAEPAALGGQPGDGPGDVLQGGGSRFRNGGAANAAQQAGYQAFQGRGQTLENT